MQGYYVDKDTEYFNGKVWKKIKDYNPEDRVLQYIGRGISEMSCPLGYEHVESPLPFYVYTVSSQGSRGESFAHIYRTSRVAEVGDKIPNSVLYNGDLTLDSRIFAYIQKGLNAKESTFSEEDFSFLYSSSYSSRVDLVSYLLSGEKYLYLSSTSYKVLNTLCSLSNWYLSIESFIDGIYKCEVTRPEVKNGTLFSVCTRVKKDKRKRDKYCISVPSGMLVLRREGKVFISVG